MPYLVFERAGALLEQADLTQPRGLVVDSSELLSRDHMAVIPADLHESGRIPLFVELPIT